MNTKTAALIMLTALAFTAISCVLTVPANHAVQQKLDINVHDNTAHIITIDGNSSSTCGEEIDTPGAPR
jgi:hypothetical protein